MIVKRDVHARHGAWTPIRKEGRVCGLEGRFADKAHALGTAKFLNRWNPQDRPGAYEPFVAENDGGWVVRITDRHRYALNKFIEWAAARNILDETIAGAFRPPAPEPPAAASWRERNRTRETTQGALFDPGIPHWRL